MYIALLFSPVPFTGCLRACRFHITSLLLLAMMIAAPSSRGARCCGWTVRCIRTGSVNSWILRKLFLGQHGGDTDQEGTAAPSKSTWACDKGACLVRKCFPRYFIGQSRKGEHGLNAERCLFGFALGNDLQFLDLRSADDILIFARSSSETMTLLVKVFR